MPNSEVDAPADPDRAALPGCAIVNRLLGASPAGTAAFMRAWLLIEHPGPWDSDALERALAEAFPPAALQRLTALRSEGLRPLLIRRPGRHHRVSPPTPRTVLVGGGTPGRHWLERLEVTDLRELAGLDLDAVAGGLGGVGEPVDGPVFLVCTHGTKDLCCAVLGRPLVAALAAEHPGRTWETSHVGGDRWAGNLLVVPDGFLHGQLSPEEAARVAKAALAGEVDPERLRGRTAAPTRWSQVAEIAVQRRTGHRGLDDVIAIHERPLPAPISNGNGNGSGTGDHAGDQEARQVTVRAGHQLFAVTLRHQPPEAGAPSRCSELVAPSGYRAEKVVPVPPPR